MPRTVDILSKHLHFASYAHRQNNILTVFYKLSLQYFPFSVQVTDKSVQTLEELKTDLTSYPGN